MVTQLSPNVRVTEQDFTDVVPAVGVARGGYAGNFRWGPTNTPITIANERQLVRNFGIPAKDASGDDFFTASNYLLYSGNLTTMRVKGTGQYNASVTTKENDRYKLNSFTYSGIIPDDVTYIEFTDIDNVKKYVRIFDTPNDDDTTDRTAENVEVENDIYFSSSTIPTEEIKFGYFDDPSDPSDPGHDDNLGPDSGFTFNEVVASGATVVATPTKITTQVGPFIGNRDDFIDPETGEDNFVEAGFGLWIARYPGALGNTLDVILIDAGSYKTNGSTRMTIPQNEQRWLNEFPQKPDNDEIHMLVIDRGGLFTGTKGTILERNEFLSKNPNGVDGNGLPNYYQDFVNENSRYIWAGELPSTFITEPIAEPDNNIKNWNVDLNDGETYAELSSVVDSTLSGGSDGEVTDGNRKTAWSLYDKTDLYDLTILPTGKVSADVANHVVGIAEGRSDAVAYVSPNKDLRPITNENTAVNDIIAYKTIVGNSTYGFMDSGMARISDPYNNDRPRWVALNGHIAGARARTDDREEAWFSHAGYDNTLLGIRDLSYNPDKIDRDLLFPQGVNPVVRERAIGFVLFGDRTLTTKESAFNFINVRQLFNVMKKAISRSAKYQLFKQNDEFTRANFTNQITPYLRQIQGRRGIEEFTVVCDTSNNTPDIVARGQFIADIKVRPIRSVRFITLNFIADNSGNIEIAEEA